MPRTNVPKNCGMAPHDQKSLHSTLHRLDKTRNKNQHRSQRTDCIIIQFVWGANDPTKWDQRTPQHTTWFIGKPYLVWFGYKSPKYSQLYGSTIDKDRPIESLTCHRFKFRMLWKTSEHFARDGDTAGRRKCRPVCLITCGASCRSPPGNGLILRQLKLGSFSSLNCTSVALFLK